MKINPLQDAALAAAAAVGAGRPDRGAAPARTDAAPAAAENAPGVPVRMSATIRALGAVRAGADIDAAKVAAVREAIASGTFRVDAEAIADKLLSNAHEFLNRARG